MPDRTVVMLDTSWNFHEGGHATGFGISLMKYGREERRITPLKRIAVLVFLASGGWNLPLGVLAAPAGKDVIEGAAQILGLWPPGYTTAPCPRIRRNIDQLKTDGSDAGRARLSDELSRQARYCAQ